MNIEKEYKKLQESAKLAADASFKLSEQVYNLKAENERLKEEIKKLKGTNGTIHPDSAYYKISKLRCKNNELERQHYDLCILKTKYKQTLQEIKAIAETYLTDCQGFKCDAMGEILQKITKAEEE